jgi:NADPH-dependent 2,4-dienoyl-CoA reductase/sulfur reductase-like enzyme
VKRGLKVTVVELQDKILSLLLDAKASDIVEGRNENGRCQLSTGQSVQKIIGKEENEGAVGGVILTKGDSSMRPSHGSIGVIPRSRTCGRNRLWK